MRSRHDDRTLDRMGRDLHRLRAALGALLLLLGASTAPMACDGDAPAGLRTGDRCGGNGECLSGLCIAGVAGNHPVCTTSCAADAECPQGWSCGGVTAHDVVVCRQGASTPFGR